MSPTKSFFWTPPYGIRGASKIYSGSYRQIQYAAVVGCCISCSAQSCAVFLSHLNLDHVNAINHVKIYWIARNQPIHCNFILRGYNCQEADKTMAFEFKYELRYNFWIWLPVQLPFLTSGSNFRFWLPVQLPFLTSSSDFRYNFWFWLPVKLPFLTSGILCMPFAKQAVRWGPFIFRVKLI